MEGGGRVVESVPDLDWTPISFSVESLPGQPDYEKNKCFKHIGLVSWLLFCRKLDKKIV